MLNVPVYSMSGEKIGDESIDEALLGATVNTSLLKQAVVMYHANQRQGSAKTKSRSEVHGSGRKLYRQKGTGRARMGNARTPIRRGGSMAFAKRPRVFRQAMPVKMRRLARNQAVLAKIQSEDALIVDGMKIDVPKTGPFAKFLAAVDGDRGCIFATNGIDQNVFRSGRNIPRTEIQDVATLNAFQVLSRRKLIFTREAFETFKKIAGGVGEARE
jgi:large subunit ribosomal protein L4